MKLFSLFCLVAVSGLLPTQAKEAPSLGKQTRVAAAAFVKTLDKDQLKEAVFSVDHENRWEMRFTGGKRPGLQLSGLKKPQRQAVDTLIGLVLSQRGLKMADQIASQDKQDRGHLYVAFFGDPRTSKSFAWRIGEHHFTVVHAVIEDETMVEFGPVLLGSNPFGPWDKEEDNFIQIWKSWGAAAKFEKGKGIATKPLAKGKGTALSQLPAGTQTKVKAAWSHRLSLFTPAVREELNALLAASGGWKSLNLAFYNEAALKLGKDGGRWDAKLGNENVLFDVETSRGHNHMSVWIKSAAK